MTDIKNDYKTVHVFEQMATFEEGKHILPFNPNFLMDIINAKAAYDEDELSEMKNPKRLVVRVIIQTQER